MRATGCTASSEPARSGSGPPGPRRTRSKRTPRATRLPGGCIGAGSAQRSSTAEQVCTVEVAACRPAVDTFSPTRGMSGENSRCSTDALGGVRRGRGAARGEERDPAGPAPRFVTGVALVRRRGPLDDRAVHTARGRVRPAASAGVQLARMWTGMNQPSTVVVYGAGAYPHLSTASCTGIPTSGGGLSPRPQHLATDVAHVSEPG